MRGKGCTQCENIDHQGITPAYAGKSEIVPRFEYGIEDHPRLCGEKKHERHPLFFTVGSPPPMRGKVVKRKSLSIL